MRRYLVFGLIVVYLAAAIWLILNIETPREISSVSWSQYLLLIILAAMMSALWAAILKISCKAFQCNLTLIEAFGLTSANSLLNLLPLRLGTGFKALYLVGFRGISITEFASVTGVAVSIALVTFGIGGGLALGYFSLFERAWAFAVFGLGMAYLGITVLGTALLLTASLVSRIRFPFGLQRFIVPVAVSVARLTGNRGLIANMVGIGLASVVAIGLRMWLIADIIGYDISFSGAVLLGTAGWVLTVVSVVPAGIGIREAAISGTFVAIGGGFEAGLVIAAIDRVVLLVRDLIFGGAWLVGARHILVYSIRHKEPIASQDVGYKT